MFITSRRKESTGKKQIFMQFLLDLFFINSCRGILQSQNSSTKVFEEMYMFKKEIQNISSQMQLSVRYVKAIEAHGISELAGT